MRADCCCLVWLPAYQVRVSEKLLEAFGVEGIDRVLRNTEQREKTPLTTKA